MDLHDAGHQGEDLTVLVRGFDWSATSLGPMETWPESLQTAVNVILDAPAGMALICGDDRRMIYNESYARLCGKKHPGALGARVEDAWPESRDFNRRMLDACFSGDKQTYRRQHFVLERGESPEDAWFDLYYSPVAAVDGGIVGVLATVIEVTREVQEERERTRIEKELKHSNERLHAARASLEQANFRLNRDIAFLHELFRQAPSFMAITRGPAHVFESANDSYLRLVNNRQIVGQTVAEALPEVVEQGFIALLDRVYATGMPYYGRKVEVSLSMDAGEACARRIVDFIYQPIKNDAGATMGIFIEGNDVTEHTLAEERLRVAQEAGETGTFEWFPATGVVAVSDMYRSIWGFSPDLDITDTVLLAHMHPEDRHLSAPHRIAEGRNPLEYAEFRIFRADNGEMRWIARRGQAIHQARGTETRYLGVAFDITRRKNIESTLAESRARLQASHNDLRASQKKLAAVFAQASVGLSEVDLAGRFTNVNAALCRMLGRTREELLSLGYLDIIHPEDRDLSRTTTRELSGRGGAAALEKRYIRGDGCVVWGYTSVTRIVDEHGVPQAMIAVTTDLTERRKVEEALLDHSVSLERKVERAVNERIKAEDALRHAQKMEAVGQLAAGVSHDFNNVLQIISSNLQLMELDPGASALLRSRMASAITAVDRGAKLSSQLLAFARKQPLQPAVVNPCRLLDNMEHLLRRAVGDTVEVTIDVEPQAWNILVDPNQLENAIINMAINARDAMQGQGQLCLRAKNIGGHAEFGEAVMLSVTDTGCGMSQEVLSKVFDPFFTTKEAGRGTGLGMSMVYGLVKQSGGDIRIHSAPGDGTTITIEFPRARHAESTASPPVSACIARGDETILVVEDDPAVRMTAVELLTSLGYCLLKAGNGQEALAILRSGVPVDLVFTDVFMPGSLGVRELVNYIRAAMPDTAVLLTSGFAPDAEQAACRIPDGVDVVVKPYQRDGLARQVRQALAQRHAAPVAKPAVAVRGDDLGRQGGLRILVVEDNPETQELACEMLLALGHSAHGVFSGEQALKLLVASSFDVLFSDLDLPGMSGEKLILEALGRLPGLKVMLTSGEGRISHAAQHIGAVMLPKPYDLMQLQSVLTDIADQVGTSAELRTHLQ